jgi:hypothetical protein
MYGSVQIQHLRVEIIFLAFTKHLIHKICVHFFLYVIPDSFIVNINKCVACALGCVCVCVCV